VHGFGLRAEHYADILERGVRAELCEAVTENYLWRGGRPLAVLERVRADVPISFHGVSLSLGSVDALSDDYLAELEGLCRRFEPAFVSDHVCFGSVGGHRAYDLWPVPYTEEALGHMAARVELVQARLGRRLCLENVSSYVEFRESTLREWEFLSELSKRADCLLLLDLNNVYVSAHNHGFSADAYLDGLPRDRVAQVHLAGHSDEGSHLLDNHGCAVQAEVWELYVGACRRFGPIPTIVEWDENLPSLERLESECAAAREVESHALG
jgi:uncharacterized protein